MMKKLLSKIELFRFNNWLFLSILFVLVGTNGIFCQTNDEQEIEYDDYEEGTPVRLIMFDLMFDLGIAQNNFADKHPTVNPGFNGSFLVQTKPESPSFIGFDMYFYHVDREADFILDVVNGLNVEIDRAANVWVSGMDFLFRYYPKFSVGPFEPYFESLVGFKWLFSTYNETDVTNDSNLTFQFYESNTSFSYGISAGLQLNITGDTYLNFRTTYSLGNSTAYNVRDPLADITNTEDPRDFFEIKNSATDMLRLQIGVSIIL